MPLLYTGIVSLWSLNELLKDLPLWYLSTKKRTWTRLASNSGLHGERWVIKSQSHGMAVQLSVWQVKFLNPFK